MIRDHIGLLTLAQHEDGAPHAVALYDQKEGTARCEQSAATALLTGRPALDDKIVTADARHGQKTTARTIAEKGGDDLLQIKGNQPKLLAQAEACKAQAHPPFFSSPIPAPAASSPVASTPSRSNRSPPTSPMRAP